MWVLGETSKSYAPEVGVDTASANCRRWGRLALYSSCTTSHPAGRRVNMLRARPEVLVLLGVLLTLLLDPTGKYQALVPLGVGQGIGAGKRLPGAGRWGEIAARLSEMGNFPARASPLGSGWGPSAGWRRRPRPSGPPGVVRKLAMSGPLSDPQVARTHSH